MWFEPALETVVPPCCLLTCAPWKGYELCLHAIEVVDVKLRKRAVESYVWTHRKKPEGRVRAAPHHTPLKPMPMMLHCCPVTCTTVDTPSSRNNRDCAGGHCALHPRTKPPFPHEAFTEPHC